MNRKAMAAVAAALSAALAAAAPAANGENGQNTQDQQVSGLNAPRGLAIGPSGKMVVGEGNGTIGKVIRGNKPHGPAVRKIGRVPSPDGFAPAVTVANDSSVWALTGGGNPNKGAGTLYRWSHNGKRHAVVSIMKYQRHDPDPYDLENNPTDSNPFGLAAVDKHSVLVADAAGNDLLKVTRGGHVITVARVKPRTVKAPPGLDGGPPAGTPMKAEAVITSVTVGADGGYYIGELRGYPGTKGTAEIWRVRAGSKNAVCNPKRPHRGACKRYADGLTSLVALGSARSGAIYALELSKKTWLALESSPPAPGADVGALIRIGPGGRRTEIKKGKIHIPGGVAVGPKGNVYVAGPLFGPGAIMLVKP